MVPLLGSICKGSLGICQLPRTWWKVLTRAVGFLDSDYPDNSGGLDTWCLQAIELDVDEVYDYLVSGRKEISGRESFNLLSFVQIRM